MTLNDFIEKNNNLNETLSAIEYKSQEIEKQKRELQSFKEEVLKRKHEHFAELSKYSTFNADSIGRIIAELLTTEEKEKYKYIVCTLKAKKNYGYDYITKQNEYVQKEIPIRIIVKEEHVLFFEKPIDIEMFRKLLELDIPFIVIDHNETGKLRETINLYDEDFKLTLNTPFSYLAKKEAIHYFDIPELEPFHYLVIKDYIDRVINYRLENKAETILDSELYKILKEQSPETISEENDDIKRQQLISSIMAEEAKYYCQDESQKALKKEKR